jgi:hypothetical protein
LVRRDERDEERRDAHQQQRRNQRSLAAKSIPVMAENRRTDWPGKKADGVNSERFERADERIRVREIQPGKDETRDGAVKEEVIPLDRGTDGARDNRAAKLPAVFLRRDGASPLVAHSHSAAV